MIIICKLKRTFHGAQCLYVESKEMVLWSYTRMVKNFNKEISKCEINFTGHRVPLVLDLSLAKAGLKKRIRHSCSDLSILGILMFPDKWGKKKTSSKKPTSQYMFQIRASMD